MRLREFADRRPALAFVLLTYALTWGLVSPVATALVGKSIGQLPVWLLGLGLIGAYGPTLSAIILTGIRFGKPGLRALFRKLLLWRVGIGWWLYALLLPAALYVGALAVYAATGGVVGSFIPALGLGRLAPTLLFLLPFGPLAEELGWRGYLLPHLQQRTTALFASLALGVIWTAWHLPFFWIPGAALPAGSPVNLTTVGPYLLGTTGTAVFFTVLANHSKGSVLLAIVLHLMSNGTRQVIRLMLPSLTAAGATTVQSQELIVGWLSVVLLLLVFGARHLTRKPEDVVTT